MPQGRGPKFRPRRTLKARDLNAVSERSVGVFVSSKGGFRRVGGGGGVSYVPPAPREREPFIVAKITGNTAISTNRWRYSWTEQSVSGDDFTDKTTARSGTTSDGYALNGLEANNSGAGIQGNGVDLDGQTFTDNADLELQPAATNAVVLLYVVPDPAGGKSYVFFYENAIDGECA